MIAILKVVDATSQRSLRDAVIDRPLLSSWQALLDYCKVSMQHIKTEQFRILFLDRKNVMIADELQQSGTVDHTPVYPRYFAVCRNPQKTAIFKTIQSPVNV